MSLSHWFAVATLAVAPLAAIAQQAQQQSNPADANAPVPASGYVSAFQDYRSALEEQASPDKTWRAANDEVGRLKGHAGHIRNDVAASSGPHKATSPHHGGHHH